MRQKNNIPLQDSFQILNDGGTRAFEIIFTNLYPALVHYSANITEYKSAAQEIVEEAFVIAWQQRAQITNVKGFLYTKVKNDSLNWIRSEKRRKAREAKAMMSVEEGETLAFDALVQAEVLRSLYAAIDKMPSQRKKVFQLLYREGKSVKETAQILSVSVSTVKDHKRAGILFLKKLLPLFLIFIARLINYL